MLIYAIRALLEFHIKEQAFFKRTLCIKLLLNVKFHKRDKDIYINKHRQGTINIII